MNRLRNIKIIQVVGLYYPAPMYGTALVANKIANRVSESSFSSYILTTDLNSYNPYKKLKISDEKINNVSIKRTRTLPFLKPYPYFPLNTYQKLSNLLNNYSGIIHAHTHLELGTAFAGFYKSLHRGCGYVLQPHFHPFPGGTIGGYAIRRIHDRTISRFLVRNSDAIVVMSEKEREAMCLLGANKNRIIVIPHGINHLGVCAKKIGKLKKLWKVRKNDKVIVCVARVSTDIIHFFINLLNKIDKKYIAILAGGTTNIQINKARSVIPGRFKNRIILTGFLPREDLNALYLIGDYFVKPTHYEAFGISFIEAMSVGLPILSYKVGALPEIIEDGKNGFLFKVDDIEGIAKKIERLQINKNLYNEIAKNNKEKAKQYNWDRILEQYMEIYEKLAAEIENSK